MRIQKKCKFFIGPSPKSTFKRKVQILCFYLFLVGLFAVLSLFLFLIQKLNIFPQKHTHTCASFDFFAKYDSPQKKKQS